MTALVYNFNVIADVDPYAPIGLTVIQDGLKIQSNALRANFAATGQALAITSNPATTGLLDVTFGVIQSDATGGGDSSGALFCNAAGNGYAVDIRAATASIKTVSAKAIISATLASATVAYASAAQFRATYNLDTNQIIVYQGATPIITLGSLTPQAGMAGGLQMQWENSNAAGITAATIDGFASSSSVDTITNPIKIGQPFTISTTGLGTLTSVSFRTAATPTAIATASSLSAVSGDGGGTLPFWVDGAFSPFIGAVEVPTSDGTDAATGSTVVALPDNYASVTFSSIETTDPTYIGTQLSAIGHPLVNGEFGYYINDNGLTISPSGAVSVLSAMVFTLWVHKASGIIESYSVTVNDAGAVTGSSGMTTRGITTRGITSRGSASRGIT